MADQFFIEVKKVTDSGAEKTLRIPYQFDGGPIEAVASLTLATPSGAVNGTNDDFVFTAPPIVVFRNGVNETRLGTIATNTFTFDTPPETGDDIEGLV